MGVRVRYAPSPTGLQHIGGVRTALFNYFFAKTNGGSFILRVEDTDRERYSEESLEDLYSTLDWLGIKWDEGPVVGGPCGPYIQSERTDLYREYAKRLVDMGKAYYCYCTPERLEALRKEQEASHSELQGYDGHCRHLSEEERLAAEKAGIRPVIRLKVPREGSVTFHDVLMGDITRECKDVSPDPILLKSDGFPTYHLANVVDDHFMGITHIMRAQEWIPSAPLHVLMYQAFGWDVPVFCHLPMVMGSDGHKLSKRHGSTSVRDFRAKGYLPEALLNYVSLVGWAPGGDEEFFTREQLEKIFTLERINKAPGVFDYQKLDYFNAQYIKKRDDRSLAELLAPYLVKEGILGSAEGSVSDDEMARLMAFVPGVKERMTILSDIVGLCAFVRSESLQALGSTPAERATILIPKKMDAAATLGSLSAVRDYLKEALRSGKTDDEMQKDLCQIAVNLGLKNVGVFGPLRAAVTRLSVSPPPFSCIRFLGAEESFRRIDEAIALLEKCV